jgi:Peptidase M15
LIREIRLHLLQTQRQERPSQETIASPADEKPETPLTPKRRSGISQIAVYAEVPEEACGNEGSIKMICFEFSTGRRAFVLLLASVLASGLRAQKAPSRSVSPEIICIDCFLITIISGDGQSGPPSTALPSPLVARVTSLFDGTPLTGFGINFDVTPPSNATGTILSSPAGFASGSPLHVSTLTGDDGTASVLLTLGNLAGNYPVVASVFCLGCNTPTFTEVATLPLTITTDSLPQKTAGQSYSFALQATGGKPPYAWTVQSDTSSPPPRNYFPKAFVLSSSGVISDNTSSHPTPGQFAITITATDAVGATASKPFIFPVTCGDPDLDKLGEEYEDYGGLDVTFTLDNPPACADFTQTARSVYFTFNDLNRPSPNAAPLYNWALIRYPLSAQAFVNGSAGLDAWVALLNPPQIINSGYRSPSQNAAAGGAPSSRHMWGDAVDLQNQVHPSGPPRECNPQYPNDPMADSPCVTEYNRMVKMAIKAGRSYIEPPELPCHYNCVHVDWRNLVGPFQQ